MFKAIVLGVVQGLTEFIPVSSTAHLIVLPWIMGWSGTVNSLSFDVAVHAGTLVGVVACLWKDMLSLIRKNRRLIFLIILGTVPAAVAGVMLEDIVERSLRGPVVIAASLVAVGILMLLADKSRGKTALGKITLFDALFVGAAQAVALIPGVSRSGITITAALALGIKRDEAARFSFLLSVPIIAGAIAFEGRKMFAHGFDVNWRLFAAGIASSAISGFIAVKFLLGYLKKHPLDLFVYYRFFLAFFILGWLWLNA